MTMTAETLAVAIDTGVYDSDLAMLRRKIDDRLTAARRERTINDFNIGDKVVFNDYTGTKYMRGQTAVVVSKARTKLTVQLDKPIGRFSHVGHDGMVSGVDVKVPPSIIDRVE